VPDVRRLVRVDRRVLDDRFAGAGTRGRLHGAREALEQERKTTEEDVQVSVGGGGHARDAGDRAERARNFLRDGARRLAQSAGELERDGRAEVAQFAVGRILDDHRRLRCLVQRVQCREHTSDMIADAILKGQNHLC
jgi:hypothetical protein